MSELLADPSSGTLIRPRTDADLDACVAALATVHDADRYPARWPEDPRGWLTPRDLLGAWVAVERTRGETATGPAVLGHVALTRCDPHLAATVGTPADELASVSRLFVPVTARRTGWALRLLSHAADAATGLGLRTVLEVESNAAAAIALYERAGWRYSGSMTAEWIAPNGRPAVVRAYLAPQAE